MNIYSILITFLVMNVFDSRIKKIINNVFEVKI